MSQTEPYDIITLLSQSKCFIYSWHYPLEYQKQVNPIIAVMLYEIIPGGKSNSILALAIREYYKITSFSVRWFMTNYDVRSHSLVCGMAFM